MADELTVEEVRRRELSAKLHEILGSDNIYFQPPESIKMEYPCIRYKRSSPFSVPANNKKNYIQISRYEIMVISRDPMEPTVYKIPEEFEYCDNGRHYEADNLYHDVFYIYW